MQDFIDCAENGVILNLDTCIQKYMEKKSEQRPIFKTNQKSKS